MRFWKSADFAKKYAIPVKIKEKSTENERFLCFLVRVFITDLILRHSAGLVETYSQSAENACAYKEFCNTKGI